MSSQIDTKAEQAKPQPIVEVAELNYHFGSKSSRTQVLENISLEVSSGEMVILTGPTGCGKTTLLTIMGALRTIQEGEVTILGDKISKLSSQGLVKLRRRVGFIFQMHNLFDSLSVYENVKLATSLNSGLSKTEMHDRIIELLTRLGLGERVHYKPNELSGGQRQRAAIARAIVNRPKLILADEPTAALDKKAGSIVVELLTELAEENGSGILLVTHDKRILDTASRIMNLLDGRLVAVDDLASQRGQERTSSVI